MSKIRFKIQIQNFKGTDAVCKIENTGYMFSLPIQNLPQGIKEGDFFILASLSEPEEKTNSARNVLEAMMN